MKVLHVTDMDLPARRFNGYDLLSDLAPLGVEGAQAVLFKSSDDRRVLPILERPFDVDVHTALGLAEARYSMDDLLYPWARVVAQMPAFKHADVVHYHLVHNRVISLLDLPWLTAAKPSVWTFHDPWPMTGHCIHPQECDRWKTGCYPCPDLDRLFPLQRDTTDQMWRIKHDVLGRLDVDVIVASEFMLDMVRTSPLTAHLPHVHLVPFGVHAERFLPSADRSRCRRALGIPDENFVAMFRATESEFKGLPYILEALAEGPPTRATTLLTVDRPGLLEHLRGTYDVRDLGWLHDPARYAEALCAADVLLMPSVAESFGLMAVEAMAASRPVICFEGTTVASVTHAPECGIGVPKGDSSALRAAMDALSGDPDGAERRGERCRSLALSVYDYDRYLRQLLGVYRDALARRAAAL